MPSCRLPSFVLSKQWDNEAKHVYDLQSVPVLDHWIWKYAVDHNTIIVTKDEDFAERSLKEKMGPIIV